MKNNNSRAAGSMLNNSIKSLAMNSGASDRPEIAKGILEGLEGDNLAVKVPFMKEMEVDRKDVYAVAIIGLLAWGVFRP